MTATLSTIPSFSFAAPRPSSAARKEALAEPEIPKHHYDQEERKEEQHSDDVDGRLDPLIHLAAGDQLDAEEDQASAVQRGDRQEIEERKPDGDDGHHLGEIGDAALHLGGGLLDDGD